MDRNQRSSRGVLHAGCDACYQPATPADMRGAGANSACIASHSPLYPHCECDTPDHTLHTCGVWQGVQVTPPNFFDCKHRSFAPGAFDVEVVAFLDALERAYGTEV